MTRRWCLLHGLGATGAVWAEIADRLRDRGDHVVCPDLPGHGEGVALASYTLAAMTASIVEACEGAPGIVVGHSLGGYVALEWASGRYATRPSAVMTVGSKLFFTAEERLRMQEIAAKPSRLFDSEAEAVLRYRKVAGLEPSSGAVERHLSRGVRKVDAGWRLSQDPAVNGIVVPSFAQMLTDARCPVLAAAGERDAMVPMAQLRALLPAAVQFDNAGHNVHVESPEALLRVLETLSA